MAVNYTPTQNTYKKLTPFRGWMLENFPFIAEDFDALTTYEMICKLTGYLNDVINNENLVEQDMTNLFNAYNELQNYVNTYFDNLDVQEEINNKLDNMAESGELTEIISAYLDSKAIFGYNNISEMKSASNLLNGSYAKTLGYYNVNDGGGAVYKIRTRTVNDIVDEMFLIALSDTLVAELITTNEINLLQIGIHADGVTDDSTIINGAIKYLAKNNGGTIVGAKGKVSFINNTIYIIDNVYYNFDNYTLQGNSMNTIMISGYYDESDDSLKMNYDPNIEYNGTNFPENRISNTIIKGVTLKNANIGIKALCLNQNSIIEQCIFEKTLITSVDISFSWGCKFLSNLVYSQALFTNFADWTIIDGNSFEGSQGDNEIMLSVGKGSYSCRITSNGFHHTHIALELLDEIRDLEISNNHFESFDIAIYQGPDDDKVIHSINIHNNWFYAYKNNVIGIQANSLINSTIEMNTFRDNNYTFQYYVNLVGQNVFGNKIRTYSNSLINNPNTLYNINNGTLLEYISGNNTSTSHPQIENFSGNYTFEKYIAKYNNISNQIPLCTISYDTTGHILYIDTFIDFDENNGVLQPVLFSILNTPSSGVRTKLCGIIMGNTMTYFTKEQVNTDGTPVSITLTEQLVNNNGKLRIVLNADQRYLSQPTGIIKAL